MPMGREAGGVPAADRASPLVVEDRGQVAGRDPRARCSSATARWITPLSSRTLPGQSCRWSASRASRREPDDVLAVLVDEGGPEMLGKQLDVGSPVPQRGDHQAKRADAVIELGPEAPLIHVGREVVAGR